MSRVLGGKEASELMNAQVGVLGSILIDDRCTGKVLATVKEQDFTEPTYREIYRAIKRLYNQSQAIDGIAVNGVLGGDKGDLLAGIMDMTATAANVDTYIDLLKRSALLYHLQELGHKMALAMDADDCQSLIDDANKLLVSRPGIQSVSMADAYADFFQRHDGETKPDYIRWGIPALDGRIFTESGDMVVIGGYPSDGKTALALLIAFSVAKSKRVGYFTYEGSNRKLHDRIVAAQTLTKFSDIKRNELGEDEYKTIVSMQDSLTAPKLSLIEAAGMSVSDIAAYSQAHHFDVVVVDYLQKVQVSGHHRRASDFEKVTAISSDLQQFGRRTGTVIIALSQLSRPEKKKDGSVTAPTMASLRQSGQIEQDADVVLLIYSEKPGQKESPRILKVGKNKEGERYDAIRMYFDGEHQRFDRTFNASESTPKRRTEPRQITFKELPPEEKDPWRKAAGQ